MFKSSLSKSTGMTVTRRNQLIKYQYQTLTITMVTIISTDINMNTTINMAKPNAYSMCQYVWASV